MQNNLRDFRILDALNTEARRRPVRRRNIEITEYKPTNKSPETHLALEGTVTLLAARHGNGLLAEIREAVARQDRSGEELARRMYRQYKGRKKSKLDKVVKSARKEPILADVLHGDMPLVESLFVPADLDVAFVALPYNGGRFAEGGLVVVEHPENESIDPLDIIALTHAPSLTAAEKAALANVPAEQSGLNIGNPLGPIACGVGLLVAAVVVEAAVVAVTWAITGKVDIEHMEHLSPGTIKELGPAASARELVQMRRQFLGTRFVTRAAAD